MTKTKPIELKKYYDLILATLDYMIDFSSMKIKTDTFNSTEYFLSLKLQAKEHYLKGQLTLLKKLFKGLTEDAKDDKQFVKYLFDKTGFKIDLKGQFEKSIAKIIKRQKILTEDEYREVMEKVEELIQCKSSDQNKVNILNTLIVNYEKNYIK